MLCMARSTCTCLTAHQVSRTCRARALSALMEKSGQLELLRSFAHFASRTSITSHINGQFGEPIFLCTSWFPWTGRERFAPTIMLLQQARATRSGSCLDSFCVIYCAARRRHYRVTVVVYRSYPLASLCKSSDKINYYTIRSLIIDLSLPLKC